MALKKRSQNIVIQPTTLPSNPQTPVKKRARSKRKGEIAEKNTAPSQWGRRLARLVGEKMGVTMSDNFSKNEGVYGGKDIVIKCAKSSMPPIAILINMLDRLDELWAVYIMPEGGAEIWAVNIAKVRQHGYYTHGPKVQKRVEIYRRKIVQLGRLIATLSPDEVESCDIP